LSQVLAASLCDVCSGPHPRNAGHCYMIVNGPSWAPARLAMHLQPSVQLASHAGRGLSGLCARTASDLAADPSLRGKHTSRHARAVGSRGLHAPPPAYGLPMCMGSLVHIIACPLSTHQREQSFVTSWRPTPLASERQHPRTALRFPQTGWCTPHMYGCEAYMPHLVGAVLVLCAPCAQVPSPRSAALQPDYTSITRSHSDPTSQVIL
jgi:hypothetical protein